MGIVRRHPVLSLVVVVLSSPLLALGGIVVAQHLPSCAAWRANVERKTDVRMRTRYLGEGNAQAFDRAYRHWETTFGETRDSVRAQVAHERAERRPDLCL